MANTYKIIPILTEQTKRYFVSEKDSKPITVSINGKDYLTAPLKPNVKFSLLGVSLISELVEAGIQDPTDAIDTVDAYLESIYIKFVSQVYNVPVHRQLTTRLENNEDILYLKYTDDIVLMTENDTDIAIDLVLKIWPEVGAVQLMWQNNELPFELIGYELNINAINHYKNK